MKGSERTVSKRRLAGLEALGVDVYVSRKLLARAQRSRIVPASNRVSGSEHALQGETEASQTRLRIPDQPGQASATTKAQAPSGFGAPASQSVRNPAARALIGGGAVRPEVVAPAAAKDTGTLPGEPAAEAANHERRPAAAAGSRAVAFNLLMATFAPGVLFVSDIRKAPLAPALESGVVSFLRDVMGAIGRPLRDESVAVDYFQWPLVRKPGVDASEARAREVLDGLLGRKLRESHVDLVVVMGRTASGLMGGSEQHYAMRGARIVHSEALGRLFSAPGRKEELWRALYQATSYGG